MHVSDLMLLQVNVREVVRRRSERAACAVLCTKVVHSDVGGRKGASALRRLGGNVATVWPAGKPRPRPGVSGMSAPAKRSRGGNRADYGRRDIYPSDNAEIKLIHVELRP